jgi:hypothetical protein
MSDNAIIDPYHLGELAYVVVPGLVRSDNARRLIAHILTTHKKEVEWVLALKRLGAEVSIVLARCRPCSSEGYYPLLSGGTLVHKTCPRCLGMGATWYVKEG